MRAGRLDRQVTLQKRTAGAQDAYGEVAETWTDVKVWAERRDLRGQEKWAAQQVTSRLSCTYRIYYRTDLTVQDRVVDGADTYEITAIVEVGRREGLELTVTHLGGE